MTDTRDPIPLLNRMILYVAGRVEEQPDITGKQLVELLNRERNEALDQRTPARPCKNCGHPIAERGGLILHLLASGESADRGCRAAGWSRNQEKGILGWDERIGRGIYAA